MGLSLTFDLVLFGVLLAGVVLLAWNLEPDFSRVTLFTGLVGGGLCMLWGVLPMPGTVAAR